MRTFVLTLAFGAALTGSAQGPRLVPFADNDISVSNFDRALVFNSELLLAGGPFHKDTLVYYGVIAVDTAGAVQGIGPFNSSSDRAFEVTSYQGITAISYLLSTYGVATWDGTNWNSIPGVFNGIVRRMIEFNGGLVVAGNFQQIDGNVTGPIAFWNGSTWSTMGTTLNGQVLDLEIHGGDLYIGGSFDRAGTDTVNCIAKWDGTSWAPLASGLNFKVEDLSSTSTGLWAVGAFTHTADSSMQLNRTAKWDGTSFQTLYSGTLVGFHPHIHYSLQHGHFITTEDQCIRDPDGAEESCGIYYITNMVEFNGESICIGRRNYLSYWNVNHLGKLLIGNDQVNLNVAGISARVNAMAGLGHDPNTGLTHFQIPAGTGGNTLYQHSLCAVAVQGNDLFVSPTFFPSQVPFGFTPGPWCADTSVAFHERYTQVWSMDKGLVWDHAANWNSPGYTTPYAITAWPGNGDVGNGEGAKLAPFSDPNGNGVYEPQLGELPQFLGDAAVFTILSDQRTLGWPYGTPIGLEVHTMTYGFESHPGDTLEHVLFTRNQLINRSLNTYDTLWIGSRADLDIGSPMDDFIGCDTLLQLGYAYNGSAFDASAPGFPGYGNFPPAQGITSLNAPLSSFMNFQNSASIDGDPVTDMDFYNYAHGRYRNSIPWNDLYLSAVGNYMFPGDPSDTTSLTEISAGNAPADKRFLAYYGPWYNVAPGDTICLDLAFVFAQDSLGDNISSVSLLEQRTTAVRQWYDQHATGCSEYVTLGIDDPADDHAQFAIYPNPTSDSFRLDRGSNAPATILLSTLEGRVVLRERVTGSSSLIDVSGLGQGIYVVSVQEVEKSFSERLVVIR